MLEIVSLVYNYIYFYSSLTMTSNSKDLELVIINFEDPEVMKIRFAAQALEYLDLHIIHT